MSDLLEEREPDKRFAFGKNWARFLSVLDDSRIATAEGTLKSMLGVATLEGKRFLDIGSGSGLFSLAARRLGATVHSFDVDKDSVGCTQELRDRYFRDDPSWTIAHASALDPEYLASLGKFDVVYSWGVLHHTGQMWSALENALIPLAPNGQHYIAIYNDQGHWSKGWLWVKRLYVDLPPVLRFLVVVPCLVRIWGPALILDLLRGRGLKRWKDYAELRGMSPIYDVIDWVGGYPFEVATPEAIFAFHRDRGLVLEQMKTCGGGKGCNEFVFRQTRADANPDSTE